MSALDKLKNYWETNVKNYGAKRRIKRAFAIGADPRTLPDTVKNQIDAGPDYDDGRLVSTSLKMPLGDTQVALLLNIADLDGNKIATYRSLGTDGHRLKGFNQIPENAKFDFSVVGKSRGENYLQAQYTLFAQPEMIDGYACINVQLPDQETLMIAEKVSKRPRRAAGARQLV